MKMLYVSNLTDESPDNIVNLLDAELILSNDRSYIWAYTRNGGYNRLCYIKHSGCYYCYRI